MLYTGQIFVKTWLLLSLIGSQQMMQSTNQNNPIVSYTIEVPETVQAGEQFTISVVFNIQRGWYVYAPIAMNIDQGKIPTKVTFKLPEGFKKNGNLVLPDSNRFFDTYRGNDVIISQLFQVDKKIQPGKQIVKAIIVYQTCNDDICFPPVSKEIDVVIIVNKKNKN